MSSQATRREEERRLSVRTLIIASVASAMAAIITSQFWISGTPIAAAITPVIVTLVSELLHRPTQKIAERLTAETDALPQETDARPEAAGAGPPPRRAEVDPRPARDPRPGSTPLREPGARRVPRDEPRSPGRAPDYRVYRAGPAASRDLPWGAILLTAALAFVLAAAALTLPELIAGESLGKGEGKSTLFGGGKKEDKDPQPAATEPQQNEPDESAPGSDATDPDRTGPPLEPEPKRTTPTQPEQTAPPAQTTPAPRSGTPAPQP